MESTVYRIDAEPGDRRAAERTNFFPAVPRIIGMTMARPSPPRSRKLLVAHFDVAIGPIELLGLALTVCPQGRFFVFSPTGSGQPQGQLRGGRSFLITDPALFAAVREKAAEAFEALGGDPSWPEVLERD